MTAASFISVLATTLFAIAVCLFICAMNAQNRKAAHLTGERGIQFDATKKRWKGFPLLYLFIQSVSLLTTNIFSSSMVQKYDIKLKHAGAPGGLDGIDFLSAAVTVATGAAIAGALVSQSVTGALLPGAVAGGICGAVLPFARLDAIIAKRRLTISHSFPAVIDLIALCMRAGQQFQDATATVLKEMPATNPLKFELEYMLAQLSVGKSLKESMEMLATRVQLKMVEQFVQSVLRAEAKGSSTTETLSIQADIIRTRRTELAEQTASRAAVAMLGPLMLIFLSVFILLLGPFAVKAWSGTLV